jgi:hypothetical protein
MPQKLIKSLFTALTTQNKMWTRNTTRDAEQAQDVADFGGTSTRTDGILQDESPKMKVGA